MSSATYSCIPVLQREGAPKFVMFSAPAGEIGQWASVERHTPEGQAGPQRIEKPYKVSSVKSFFDTDAHNTIPTAIVIAFKPGASVEQITAGPVPQIKVDWTNGKPGVVVDGQHRLAGVLRHSPTVPLCIVAILDADDAEIAFQFIVINNKAARVSSDHLRSLALHFDEDALAERLRKVRLHLNPNIRFVGFAQKQDESPFRGIINLSSTPEAQRFVPGAAIEDAIKAIAALNHKGLIEDDDLMLSFFFSIWKVIKLKWAAAWNGESKLLNKVPIVALTSFIGHHCISRSDMGELDINNPELVEAYTAKIIDKLNIELWTREWAVAGLDTTAGRKLMRESLEQIMRNPPEQWDKEVPLLITV